MSRRFAFTAATLTACLAFGSTAAAKSPLDGRLTVQNDRLQPVRVVIDGQPRGTVPARGSTTIRHVPNGIRMVRLKGKLGKPDIEKVSIAPRGHAHLHVAPRFGAATVRNTTKVRMRVSLDGRSLGTLRPGETLATGPLPLGRYRLTASPMGRKLARGPSIQKVLKIRPGARKTVTLGRYLGSVRVANPFPTRVAVFMDGRRAGALRPGDSLVLGDVAPGTHRFEMRHRRQRLASEAVTTAMGSQSAWTPRAVRHGNLSVTNYGHRRITVKLDGKRLGRIAPGETALFRDLPTGFHKLVLQGRHGHKQRETIHIHPNATVTAAFTGPRKPIGPGATHAAHF